MLLRLLRHATLVVEYAGVRLLVDPMLGAAASQLPMPDTNDHRPNPLVDLPVPAASAVEGVAATVVTHLHNDHVDVEAVDLLPRDRPVICQPRDAAAFASRGLPVVPLNGEVPLEGMRMTRTGGRHGTGAIGREMGEVSGFVLAADGEPTLYVAGDTVWCDEVRDAIATHGPDVIVVNAGAARFLAGDPTTMDVPDVLEVCRAAPDSLVVAVHMEAMSHCGLTRDALRSAVAAEGLDGRVLAPADGETLRLAFT